MASSYWNPSIRMKARDKIKPASEARALCEAARQSGLRVVFTNGCFDLLHLGHVRYLEEARDLGDLLVVAINSDRSVKQIKGASRPVVGQEERSEVLAALHCVDIVVIFEEPDPLAVIRQLQPDVLVKGADWPHDRIIGADLVESRGGRVVPIPLVEGMSTTRIIERILACCRERDHDVETNRQEMS
jgi:D-beta-D-heptose 7-phosphate kinase/D-beta-D-heptose 1-phosphate adenosyltransferase